MTHSRPSRRPRTRLGLVSLALLLAAPTAVLTALGSPAQAAVTSPGNGATVSGNVVINEARGGDNSCIIGNKATARLVVTRVSDNAQVHSASKGSDGSYSTTWASLGQPRGQYRIQSYARDSKKSGFANLGCTQQSESLISNTTFNLDNQAAVSVGLPSSVVTGETLPVSVKTTVVANGFTGQALGGREVTITVPGVGTDVVTTAADGTASTSFDLPDLASGPLQVSAQVTTDAAYTGRTGSASTTLTKRTTQTFYRGETRSEPGRRARLEALLVDVTPGSDRYGDPIVDQPVAITYDGDSVEVPTVASGRAVRTVDVNGASRLVPVKVAYAGDDVRLPSDDAISFFVGDDAATPAVFQDGPAGSLTGFLNGLIGTILAPVLDTLGITSNATGLQGLLHTLVTDLGSLGQAGDPVDQALGAILTTTTAGSPLGDVVSTAGFTWRSVYVNPDGTRRAREFAAVIGVPQPLDVTGDSVADVIASVTLAEIGPGTLTPRLTVARIGNVSANLPLSLQAIIDLPGSDQYRFGYDTRSSSAPRSFTADVVLGDGGAVLQVASEGESALDVSGAIEAAGAAEGADQRFAVSFDAAPPSAQIGFDLDGSQNIAASLQTDRPTKVGLSLIDDGGGDEVFVADGVLDSVDGDLALTLSGTEETGLGAQVTSDDGLDSLSLTARTIDAGRTVSDIRLALSDVPDVVSFGLTADGAGELTASAPIGVFEAGYASGRDLLQLDDPAYLRLRQEGETQSIALRLPGFEGMSLGLGDDLSLGLTLAPTPLRALVEQEGRTFDARISDAPHQLDLSLSPEGAVSVEGSDPISEVSLTAHDATGILSGATGLDLSLVDVPKMLTVGVEDDGVSFDTGGESIGQLEVFADNGTHLAVPGGGDGLVVDQSADATAIAGRISGLRAISASLGDVPDILLDTVAGKVFTIKLTSTDEAGVSSDINATLDHLVPHMRLGLVDDGSGATRLSYSADEPTNSLSFDLGELSGSISNPLPADLLVCMADDEACLPDLGIDDPGLGSVRFAASEPTTLNLTDPAGGLSAQNLRLQLLDLTGTVDTDTGGDVYLNTTEFGGACGTAGCVRPIQGGRIVANLGSAGLTFEPGNGFFAKDALTNLKIKKLLGQPIGLEGTGGTGVVNCVGATKLDVTVFDIPILGDITLSVKDAICNVNRS